MFSLLHAGPIPSPRFTNVNNNDHRPLVNLILLVPWILFAREVPLICGWSRRIDFLPSKTILPPPLAVILQLLSRSPYELYFDTTVFFFVRNQESLIALVLRQLI